MGNGYASEEGAWIFVSHSHRDLHRVRRVRDELESMGHQPLLFFLMCLNDGSEIDDLIRREISARQFFLLCDSRNARASRWVAQEKAVIRQLRGKVSLTVDLHGPWKEQVQVMKLLSRKATVSLAYAGDSARAANVAGEISDELHRHDYRLHRKIELEATAGQVQDVDGQGQAVNDALDDGSVLLVLTPEVFGAQTNSDPLTLPPAFDVFENPTSAGRVAEILRRRVGEGRPSSVVPVVVDENSTNPDAAC